MNTARIANSTPRRLERQQGLRVTGGNRQVRFGESRPDRQRISAETNRSGGLWHSLKTALGQVANFLSAIFARFIKSSSPMAEPTLSSVGPVLEPEKIKGTWVGTTTALDKATQKPIKVQVYKEGDFRRRDASPFDSPTFYEEEETYPYQGAERYRLYKVQDPESGMGVKLGENFIHPELTSHYGDLHSATRSIPVMYESGMTAKPANQDYSGIGTRLHQIAIERCLQMKLKGVWILALPGSVQFHKKMGFQPQKTKDGYMYLPLEKMAEWASRVKDDGILENKSRS